MSKVLPISAAIEVATGVALLVVPSLVGQLLLGHELSGIAIPVARVAGIALIALGLACWPGRDEGSDLSRALRAMLFYNPFVALYLAYLGIGRQADRTSLVAGCRVAHAHCDLSRPRLAHEAKVR